MALGESVGVAGRTLPQHLNMLSYPRRVGGISRLWNVGSLFENRGLDEVLHKHHPNLLSEEPSSQSLLMPPIY
jgi:hypothetical protein